MTRACVVLTTVGTEDEASRIGHELVSRRHAACVNALPVAQSVYRWKGKICQDSEFLLVIKTLVEELPALESAIRELHSYDLPEIIRMPLETADSAFLDWIVDSLDKDADFEDEDEDDGDADSVDIDLVFHPDETNV